MENKVTQVTPDFLNELKDIDSRLEIVNNPNYPQLANIKLSGMDVCPIPRETIKDEPDNDYFIVSTNGWKMRHKSKQEALALVRDVLEKIKTPEGYDLFFNK